MTTVAQAIIEAKWFGRKAQSYHVKYNPKEFTLEKGLQHAEIAIPGLETPLQQFVRGQAEKLTVELFFDTTDDGMGPGATSVTEHTDEIYKLCKIENSSHAPPIVTFSWNSKFSGADLAKDGKGALTANQCRNSFVGVVESVRQQFTLFSSEGIPLRATVNLTLIEYRPLDKQLAELRRNSPDKTHSHPLSDRETLSQLSGHYYNNNRKWRYIANENRIEDPRRLHPGIILRVPAITGGK